MIPNFSWSTCLNSGVLWFSGKSYWLFESINAVKSEEHQYLQDLTRGRKGRHWWEEHQIQRRRKAAACKTSLAAATGSRPPTATPGESCTGDTWTLSYIAVTYGYSVFTINTLWSMCMMVFLPETVRKRPKIEASISYTHMYIYLWKNKYTIWRCSCCDMKMKINKSK